MTPKPRWLAMLGPALLVALSGCSSESSQPSAAEQGTADATKQTYTRQSILEACVRMHSCGIERLTRVSDCVARYENVLMMAGQAELYKALHLCVNQAGADCAKISTCFGVQPGDAECDYKTYKGGCDGDVKRFCSQYPGDRRVYRVDCAAGGLKCALDDKGTPTAGAVRARRRGRSGARGPASSPAWATGCRSSSAT